MATISSHVLDAVIGSHAAGIRVQCFRRNSPTEAALVFDVHANEQGRISETVEIPTGNPSADYELVFYSRDYFLNKHLPDDGFQIMEVVVIRLSLPDPAEKYHIPMMLAPHSYSVWWSGAMPEAT